MIEPMLAIQWLIVAMFAMVVLGVFLALIAAAYAFYRMTRNK